jgi:acyl-[acyl-carrier-protein]-phospholipid O-acyltransferase/long-chain-fatty-acid--[acyl-carrier-protein] ligase
MSRLAAATADAIAIAAAAIGAMTVAIAIVAAATAATKAADCSAVMAGRLRLRVQVRLRRLESPTTRDRPTAYTTAADTIRLKDTQEKPPALYAGGFFMRWRQTPLSQIPPSVILAEHPFGPVSQRPRMEHASETISSIPRDAAGPQSPRPPLLEDASFWGMTATQFLGAFNDNLIKQLALLIAAPAAVGMGVAAKEADEQPLAMALFSIPFLLFSSYAGFLSERNSKRTIIVLCKVAEIGIVLLGMAAFALWNMTGMAGLLVVLFLMGTHSAFFGPGKYGILPELFAERDLPKANGIILMTTFLAIIFGMALAGFLEEWLGHQRLWMASGVCLVIAVVGTQTALLVRPVPPADPALRFTWSALLIPQEMRALLNRDRPLLWAIIANSVFWLIGGVVQPTVNAVGKDQFAVGSTLTSLLAACMGVGIAIGSVLAIGLSRGKVNFTLVKAGAWLITATLGCLSLSQAQAIDPRENPMLLIVYGAGLVLLGAFAGLFAVPLQVFLQTRPPAALKGRTIATNNLANWIGIVGSAGVYWVFARTVETLHWPRTAVFALGALMLRWRFSTAGVGSGEVPAETGLLPGPRLVKKTLTARG